MYIRLDAMVCGFFQVVCLPAASPLWRDVDSLGINQANSFFKIISVMKERVWKLCDLKYQKIHLSTDTTVETFYGHQQGGRKGHNTKNRDKKGYRRVLCFIDETREYLLGKLQKGETMSGEEVAKCIRKIKTQLPGCVKKVVFRADGEFFSLESVDACIDEGFDYIIANKAAHPPFDPKSWYRPKKHKPFEYNPYVNSIILFFVILTFRAQHFVSITMTILENKRIPDSQSPPNIHIDWLGCQTSPCYVYPYRSGILRSSLYPRLNLVFWLHDFIIDIHRI
jgi:hypothetical protein